MTPKGPKEINNQHVGKPKERGFRAVRPKTYSSTSKSAKTPCLRPLSHSELYGIKTYSSENSKTYSSRTAVRKCRLSLWIKGVQLRVQLAYSYRPKTYSSSTLVKGARLYNPQLRDNPSPLLTKEAA
jgi:hypothetical protein